MTVKGPSRGWKLVQYIRDIRRHNGLFHVTDCSPWGIKAGCERQDCPMRTLAIAPEAQDGALLLQCDPPGELADTLIAIRNTQD